MLPPRAQGPGHVGTTQPGPIGAAIAERQPLPGALPEQRLRRETPWLLPPSNLWAWSGQTQSEPRSHGGLWNPACGPALLPGPGLGEVRTGKQVRSAGRPQHLLPRQPSNEHRRG